MRKPISTRVHGIIDYAWSAAASALSNRLDGANSTANLLRTAATAAATSSLATRYEAGLLRVMPMKGHLALDYALCGALLASPLYLPASERRYAAWPVLLGAMGMMTAMLTKTHSPIEPDAYLGVFYEDVTISEVADQDPDVAVSPNLRHQLE